MSFFDNTRKPDGLGGKLMVSLMNVGHRSLAHWGMQFLPLSPDARVLDCGCGGGANLKKLLKRCPQGIVKGIDYSAVSVEKSRKLNDAAIREGRCVVWQGSVAEMIFAASWFDAVTALRYVYFWLICANCFRESSRTSGRVFSLQRIGDTDKDEKWTERIAGMTIYRDVQLQAALEQAGFHDIEIHKNEKDWLCMLARK